MHKCCHPKLARSVLSLSAAQQVHDSLRRSVSHTELLDALDLVKIETKYPTHGGFFSSYSFWSCWFVVSSSQIPVEAVRFLLSHVESV